MDAQVLTTENVEGLRFVTGVADEGVKTVVRKRLIKSAPELIIIRPWCVALAALRRRVNLATSVLNYDGHGTPCPYTSDACCITLNTYRDKVPPYYAEEERALSAGGDPG